MSSRALVLGGGGREHALAVALARSASVSEVLVAPGNGGCQGEVDGTPIRRCAIEHLKPAEVVALAKREKVDLVVVGPETPLCDGVVDALDEAGIVAFGPSAAAARLEGSKAFMKQFCSRHDIPTAPYIITQDIAQAEAYIDERACQVVIKADGLAGGKGAVVTSNTDEAKAAARAMLVEGKFGDAGRTIVIEDRLEGYELSVHLLCDGKRYTVLPVSRDHKRVGDDDTGPNTGGMGAFAPLDVDPALMARIEERTLRPTIEGMAAEGAPYRGVLYAGVMVSPDGTPYLLEHNVRFGDPETQVLMPLLSGDVADLLRRAATGTLEDRPLPLMSRTHSVVVVLAAGGYPASPRTGHAISGLADAAQLNGVSVYHAGTKEKDGELLTNGGRVLGISACGSSASQARQRAYQAIEKIRFEDMHYRRDIATSASN